MTDARLPPIKVATMQLLNDQKGRPVMRVFFPDGRTTEFREKPLVLTEGPDDGAGNQIYFVPMNGKGEFFVDKKGDLLIFGEIPLTVQMPDNDDAMISRQEAAGRAGVSVETVKRAIKSGELEAQRVGEWSVRIRAGNLKRWIDRHRKK